jgi:hypothetical protein
MTLIGKPQVTTCLHNASVPVWHEPNPPNKTKVRDKTFWFKSVMSSFFEDRMLIGYVPSKDHQMEGSVCHGALLRSLVVRA